MAEINNFKLSITGVMSYPNLKRVCDAICEQGYDCTVVDNGNFVFDKK